MSPAAAWASWADPRRHRARRLALAGAFRHGHVPLEKPPEALAERAKEIIRRLGYAEKPPAPRGASPATARTDTGSKNTTSRGPMEGHGERASGGDLLLVPAEPSVRSSRSATAGRPGEVLVTESIRRPRQRHERRPVRPAGPAAPVRGGAAAARAARGPAEATPDWVDALRRSGPRPRPSRRPRRVASALLCGRADGLGGSEPRTGGPAGARRGGVRKAGVPPGSSWPDPGAAAPHEPARP